MEDAIQIRKIVTLVDEARSEAGIAADLDAPLPDEIAIICAYANRGCLNHRVGGLASEDIKGLDGLV